MICANCGKPFNSGPPKFKKEDEKKKVLLFCSEQCMKSYI